MSSYMLSLTSSQLDSAIGDIRAGIFSWRLTHFLAWQDVKQKYRRSTLGPLWLTLSFGIQILTMGFLSAFLFTLPIAKSLPYVCSGMLLWSMITQVINDGANLFVSTARYLMQIKSPLTVFLFQTVWRNVIIAAHNAVIYVAVAVIFFVVPGSSILLWPLGAALSLIAISWMALVAAIVSARFRDVPIMLTNVLNILFWFTPLMYFPEQLGAKRFIADYNPFTHIVALVREPLLGGTPTLNDWLVVLAVAVFGWAGTFLFFARFRARIVYWL
jgi:ABC-type polysaccharide/polyol phosphate export permease